MNRHVIPDVVHDQHLLTLTADDSVRTAARQMTERRVRSVLVVGPAGGLEGIFTGTDLIERVIAAGLDPDATRLDAVMTAAPMTIPPETIAIEALRAMHEAGYRHLPVVEEGRLLGIVSRRDFLADEEEELQREQRLWERL